MTKIKTLAASLTLVALLSMSAFAGEINTPSCVPGEMNTPPCSAVQQSPDDTTNSAETEAPAAAETVAVLNTIVDAAVVALLSVF